ncbi:MAG TPA: hypothetical protein VLW85_03690 [Myxococcales bacterium]|nr:hypothetical protein [Myxococcales bacterium]
MELTAPYASAEEFLAAYDEEIAFGGLLVRGAELPPGTPLSDCTVRVTIEGAEVAHANARLAGSAPGHGVMVLLTEKGPLEALAARLRAPATAKKREVMPLTEKMAIAMSCDRDLRMQFLKDPNKQLHPLVLKNPRIAVDEVHWAAKLPTLNPDALKLIAEHPEWGQNQQIVAALVRNPKTPLQSAVKLVPKLPNAELRQIARSQGRPQIIQAAKKKLMNER